MDTAASLAPLIIAYAANVYRHGDRRAMAESASRFHERAGTLTASVAENLSGFAAGLPLIRIAYTPDHFANLALYGEALFAEQLAIESRSNGLATAQALVIVDSEVVTDKRSRSSVIPDVKRHESLLRLAWTVPPEQHRRLARHVEPPDEVTVRDWMAKLRASVHVDLRELRARGVFASDPRRPYTTVREITEHALEAARRAISLSDFNMIFAARIINLAWRLPIAFVSLSESVPHVTREYEQALALYPEMVSASEVATLKLRRQGFLVDNNVRLDPASFPMWFVCEVCHSRVAMAILPTTDLRIDGYCHGCSARHRFAIGSRHEPDLSSVRNRVLPRMLFDNLTEQYIWGVAAGISNAGSVRHLLPAAEIARLLDIPVAPEALLRLRGIYFGPAELRVAASRGVISGPTRAMLWRIFWGRASIIYYLVSQGIDGLRDTWQSWFASSRSIAGTNIATSRFNVRAADIEWLKAAMAAIPPR
jgi:hypothetical protein